MTFVLAVTLLALSAAVGATAAFDVLVELALRNWRTAAIAALVALTCVPLVLIGANLTNLATPLVAHP